MWQGNCSHGAAGIRFQRYLYSGFECLMVCVCVYVVWQTICASKELCILINLRTSQGKHRGTDASSSQGSMTGMVGGEIVLVV